MTKIMKISLLLILFSGCTHYITKTRTEYVTKHDTTKITLRDTIAVVDTIPFYISDSSGIKHYKGFSAYLSKWITGQDSTWTYKIKVFGKYFFPKIMNIGIDSAIIIHKYISSTTISTDVKKDTWKERHFWQALFISFILGIGFIVIVLIKKK